MNEFKLYLCISILSLLLLPIIINAQGVGVGINTYTININGSVFDSYTVTPKIINPSKYEIKVKVYFDCGNCVKDVKVFGNKIGETSVDYKSFFTFDKDDVTVPPMAIGDNAPSVAIKYSPQFITRKYLKLYTPEFINFFIRTLNKNYKNSITLPYFSLLIGQSSLRGLMVADVYASSFGGIGVAPSVGAVVNVDTRGMPLSSFIFMAILLVLIILFILNKLGFLSRRRSKQKKTE